MRILAGQFSVKDKQVLMINIRSGEQRKVRVKEDGGLLFVYIKGFGDRVFNLDGKGLGIPSCRDYILVNYRE